MAGRRRGAAMADTQVHRGGRNVWFDTQFSTFTKFYGVRAIFVRMVQSYHRHCVAVSKQLSPDIPQEMDIYAT